MIPISNLDTEPSAREVDFLGDDTQRSVDLRCPHCGSLTWRRTSRQLTVTFRELYYICRNVPCGHTFKASLSYDYGLSPSAIPNPAVDLPMRPMDRIPGYNARAPDNPALPDPNQPDFFNCIASAVDPDQPEDGKDRSTITKGSST